MADRPQINNWNNINLNKPEEYSSEFTVDGNRYANVTNVTTGQRQLYYIQPFSNARGLLTTTNADGTVTKGSNYNNFVQFQGQSKLNNAEKANKQQSVSLLSNPKLSTPEEAKKIANSKEFKSTATGTNAAKTAGATSEQISAAAGKETKGTRNEFPGANGSDPLRYPTNLKNDYQDVIKFNMVKYSPKKFSSTSFGFGSRDLAGSNKDRQIIGTVVLPIPAGISDQNAVNWAGQDMNALQPAGAAGALGFIEGGAEGGSKSFETSINSVSKYSDAVKKAISVSFAEQAVGVQGLLTRTTGLIINPNMELLFQAPTLRPFTFNFKLSARNSTEAQIIRSIIRFFKQGMSPIRTESNLFLKSPHTFQMQYLHQGKPHNYLNKFKECALQSFTVNYTAENQYATFTDGAMVSYQITMQFQELEPVFNDDYTEGAKSTGYDTEIGY